MNAIVFEMKLPLFILILHQVSAELFSGTVGVVSIPSEKCSVLPARIYKRFDSEGQKPLAEYSTENLENLMNWFHTTHGARPNIDNILMNLKEKSICFSNPTEYLLKRLVDGGHFTDRMQKFHYREVPEYWIAQDDDMSNWKELKLQECLKTGENQYKCTEEAIGSVCTVNHIDECSEKLVMDSSPSYFTFVRPLSASSHVVATVVPTGSMMINGNIFDMKSISFPSTVFKLTLAPSEIVAIGNKMIKN